MPALLQATEVEDDGSKVENTVGLGVCGGDGVGRAASQVLVG